MATATFAVDGLNSVDFLTPNTNYRTCACGIQYLIGKSLLRRPMCRWSLFQSPIEGRPLTAADEVTAAEFIFDVLLVLTASQPARVERISRDAWDYTVATWNKYDGVNAWTAGGGDFAAPLLQFTSPAATGEFVLPGALDFVTDALDNRAGVVRACFRMDDEDPGHNELWSATGYENNEPLRPRLRVTYIERNPSPIDRPEASTLPGSALASAGRSTPPARPTPPAGPYRRSQRNGR